jgi:hypothetical protein
MLVSKRALAAIVFGTLAPLLMTTAGLAADPAAAGAKAPNAKPAAPSAPQVANLTAAQIIEKHVVARGGLQAWKAVQTLQLSGKLEAGRGDSYARAMQMVEGSRKRKGNGTPAEGASASGAAKDTGQQVQLPFKLDVKRPNKTRLEIDFAGKTALQVYDGVNGWKLRPFLNRSDVEPFTAEEKKSEGARGDLDGPLIDYTAKGTKVALEGAEAVEGQPAYRLKVTLKNGTVQHVWIDAKSFLDIKVDGVPRRMDGKMHNVYVYQRDFRQVEGVLIPFVMETAVDGYPDTHKMIVEKAAVNPKLDDALFGKPRA